MNFNELDWHDAVIVNLHIDRSNPGNCDIVEIEIVWSNGIHNVLSFTDVYWANLDMNFGIIASESIRSAFSEDANNPLVKSFYMKWKGLFDEIVLNYYEIETNSTGSIIKIISRDFSLHSPR